MRGTLRACDSGAPLLTTLDATIYVPHTAEALCGRPMLIRGQLCLGAGSTPYEVEGDLTLDFLGTRRVTYELSWRDQSTTLNRLYGFKQIRAKRLVSSWTEMSALFTRGGEVQARGTLTFSLSTLPSLLTSVRLL